MANSLLTIDMITREAIRLFINTNEFIQSIDRQYDDQFAKTGAKIGNALRIRLPNDYTVRTGAVAAPQDTAEQQTTLTLATQKGVDVSFSSVQRSLSLDDFSSRVLKPMMNNLVGDVAADIMGGVEGGISNFVSNTDGSGDVDTPTAETWLLAGAKLDENSGPKGSRKVVLDPLTQARTVSSLAGLFNPQPTVSAQFKTAQMASALGFEWCMDQTVLKHVTSTYSGTLDVNGADQTGTTLVTGAITGGFNKGDIITIEGVNAVNRVTKEDIGSLRQFVVTEDAATGATSISIYPAIVPPDAAGNKVAHQTVTASPANDATITVVTASAETYRKNFAFVPEAVTMATADLELPKGVHEAHRESYDGISMRMVSAYNIGTDQFITRLDVLYGSLWVRPEWACVVADKL
jgi:hypothetical protein